MSARKKVLVVDDSATMRNLLVRILSRHPGLQVVAAAADPYEAREMVKAHQPDVMTLDVEMPRMDGLTFLRKLMSAHPMPVVMVSSLTEQGTDAAVEALGLGAVDVVGKSHLAPGRPDSAEVHESVADAVWAAAHAAVAPLPLTRREWHPLPAPPPGGPRRLIAVGASTGGTEALRRLLRALPAGHAPALPPILIVQHMLEGFSRSFAAGLDRDSELRVKEAEDGEAPQPGTAYLAPGGTHLEVERASGRLRLRLSPGPPIRRHRPSVDMLFRSAAALGAGAMGLILTGMGDDGAQGLLEMRRAGAWTLGQDEGSCTVYGMPRAAMACGAVTHEVPLDRLPACLLRWAES